MDYVERARRETLTPMLEADWAEASKQMGTIQESLKKNFEKQLEQKNKIIPAKEYIVSS